MNTPGDRPNNRRKAGTSVATPVGVLVLGPRPIAGGAGRSRCATGGAFPETRVVDKGLSHESIANKRNLIEPIGINRDQKETIGNIRGQHEYMRH